MKLLTVRIIAIAAAGLLSVPAMGQSFQRVGSDAGLGALRDLNGQATADFDGDGDLDVYLVAYRQYDESMPITWNRLMVNQGDGTFVDEADTRGAQTTVTGYYRGGMGNKFSASWGDYDNDGDPDLFVAQIGPDVLFRNEGGMFVDVTEAAGVTGPTDSTQTSNAVWWDYDRDGLLDLYTSAWLGQNELYRNRGDGTFENVTEVSGLGDEGWTWSALPIDTDEDGWLDLYVVNDFGPNRFYRNNGDGTFTEQTAAAGLEDEGNGMGIAIGDYNEDGRFDLYVTNIYEYFPNPLFEGTAGSAFVERAADVGVDNAGWAWGTEFFDCDHDGDLDLYVSNGFIIDPGVNRLFVNRQVPSGVASFDESAAQAGVDAEEEARSLLVFDYDNDGDLDLLVGHWWEAPELFRNEGANGNWLKIALEGTTSNRDGFGAVVTARIGDRVMKRHHDGVDIFGQSVQPVHFGLGSAQTVDEVIVHWPSGLVQRVEGVAAGQTLSVVEGEATSTESGDFATGFSLGGIFPNPSSGDVQVDVEVTDNGPVSLEVFDLLGRQVHGRDARLSPGRHTLTLTLDASLPAGLYVLRVRQGERLRFGRLIRE